MFGNFMSFLKKFSKEEKKDSKDTAKERLHLVLMQDRANVSADFMELMKQEIIEVIKKYIDVDENAIDVKLTNKVNGDGTTGAPILYANIPILNVKDDTKQINIERNKENKEIEENNKEEEDKDQNQEKDSSIEEKNEEAEEPKILKEEHEADGNVTFLKLKSDDEYEEGQQDDSSEDINQEDVNINENNNENSEESK